MKKNLITSILILVAFVLVTVFLVSRQPRTANHYNGGANVVDTFTPAEYGTNVTEANCTQAPEYWEVSPEAWPVENLPVSTDETSAFSFDNWHTWMNIFTASEESDIRILLTQQLLAAKLSVTNGADATEITTAVTKAEELLKANGEAYVDLESPVGQQMFDLAKIFILYNHGLIGPGNCNE